jgi:hypothetical protein
MTTTLTTQIRRRTLARAALLTVSRGLQQFTTPDGFDVLLAVMEPLLEQRQSRIAANVQLFVDALPLATGVVDAVLDLECAQLAQEAVDLALRQIRTGDLPTAKHSTANSETSWPRST